MAAAFFLSGGGVSAATQMGGSWLGNIISSRLLIVDQMQGRSHNRDGSMSVLYMSQQTRAEQSQAEHRTARTSRNTSSHAIPSSSECLPNGGDAIRPRGVPRIVPPTLQY